MGEHVRLQHLSERRAEVLLDRPDKLNALTLEMLRDLGAIGRTLSEPGSARVAVLRSTSRRAFSVGADIGEWAGFAPLAAVEASRSGTEAIEAFARMSCPVVAALSGHCLGGGLELALACDLRVADTTVRLGFPEATLGTATGWGGLPRLVATLGPGRAKRLMLTGEVLDAEEAWRLGILDVLVEPDALDATVDALAERISANAPVAVQTIKRLIDALAAPDAVAAQLEALASGVHAATEDARRGKQAFIERSRAEFTGA